MHPIPSEADAIVARPEHVFVVAGRVKPAFVCGGGGLVSHVDILATGFGPGSTGSIPWCFFTGNRGFVGEEIVNFHVLRVVSARIAQLAIEDEGIESEEEAPFIHFADAFAFIGGDFVLFGDLIVSLHDAEAIAT